MLQAVLSFGLIGVLVSLGSLSPKEGAALKAAQPSVPVVMQIAYDDGTAETGRGRAMARSGYAVRFTPPLGRIQLLTAKFYILGFKNHPAPIEIHVWDTGHNDLIRPLRATPTERGWFELDLSPQNLIIGGDFYIGYLQTTAEAYPWIGLDTTNPDGRSYMVPDWLLVTSRGKPAGDIMIRAEVMLLQGGGGGQIRTTSYPDGDERNIDNSEDFAQLTFQCDVVGDFPRGDGIGIEVEFYDELSPGLTFLINLSTDEKADPEFHVRSSWNRFDVLEDISGSWQSIYWGTPSIDKNKYNIVLPWTQLFPGLNEVKVWLSVIETSQTPVPDRLPDPPNSQLLFIRPSCELHPLPDLQIAAISWSPRSPQIGQDVTFAVEVQNVGVGLAKGFEVVFTVEGAASLHQSVISLGPGDKTSLQFVNAPLPSDCGSWWVKAEVDPSHQVIESEEGNNIYRADIFVECPPPVLLIPGTSSATLAYPGGGEIMPETVGGLDEYENATVFLKGFRFTYSSDDHHVNEIGLNFRDIQFNEAQGVLSWNTELVYGDGGNWPFDDDFSWSYDYLIFAFHHDGEVARSYISEITEGGVDHRISAPALDTEAVSPVGFRFDFLGVREETVGTDDPQDHHLDKWKLIYNRERYGATYADWNSDDEYYYEIQGQIFRSPDILVIPGPDPSPSYCDGPDCITLESVNVPEGYGFATVLLQGWRFDFAPVDTDHHIKTVQVRIFDEHFDPVSRTLSWSVQVEYSDADYDDPDDNFYWQYWYSLVAFRSAELGVSEEPTKKVYLEQGGKVVRSNFTIFGGEDDDGDGLDDYWENEVIRQINPYFELDEEEGWYFHRHEHPVVNFVRVTPFTIGGRQYIIFFYVISWARDYGYGFAGRHGAHNGDTERVVMAWQVEDDRTIRLKYAYHSAHEGDGIFDESRVTSVNELDSYGGRVKLFASEHKHALYNSCGACEDALEDCCGGGTFRFPVYNVGEPDHLWIDDLTPYGFPGEAVSSDQFCGGLGDDGNCGGSILSKCELPQALYDILAR